MHETALCRSIVEIVRDQAREHGFERVSRVRVEVGPFSCVEVASLEFGFDVAARNSPAEGATFEIRRTKGRAHCTSCAREVEIDQRYDPCPVCGDFALKLTAGDELRVTELEVS